MRDLPETKYAKSGEIHIAYQRFGSGPTTMIAVPPIASNVEVIWESETAASFLERTSSFCDYIQFDKRGTGLSDRVPPAATLEERVDDIRAVLDAENVERVSVGGASEGGALAALFAATYPERTRRLVMFASFARLTKAEDQPWALDETALMKFIEIWTARWGQPSTLTLPLFAPSRVGEREYLRVMNRYERQSASPGTLRDLMLWMARLDIRSILPTIRVPTLILHRKGDAVISVEHSRYLAERIPGAKYMELEGSDHLPWEGDQTWVDEAEAFVTGHRPTSPPSRMLATVLFTDIVGSTERAAALGDAKWRELLNEHDARARQLVATYRGRWVKSTGDGLLATFDGPARGVRCAGAIRDALADTGMEIRAGLHCGELEVRGDDVGGIAVHIAARVNALAGSGEVIVSRTVKDLVVGSGLTFVDRGSHCLKGVPDEWQLFAWQP